LISSVSVYGNYGSLEVTEDFKCNAKGEYAQSKRFSELKAIEICKKNSIKLTVLRLGTVIGENDRGNTARLITQINNNRFIWIGKGKNRKTLVYKKDVAEIIGKIVENEEFEAGTFNLVAKPLAMKKIVEIIFENLGKKKPKIFLPEQIVRKFFIINKILNIDLLERLEKIVDKWLSDEIFSGKKIFLQHNLAPKTEIGDALKKQISAFEPE
jgi:nucleoside-diphosphate-sugar epimerase